MISINETEFRRIAHEKQRKRSKTGNKTGIIRSAIPRAASRPRTLSTSSGTRGLITAAAAINMRVIAPRRSSTSAAGSGSLYGTSAVGTSSGSTTSSNSTSGSHHISITGSGAVDRTSGGAATNGYSRISSSYDRGSSLSKWLPTSSGGSNSSGYGSSYYPTSYSTFSANSGSSSASYAPRSSVQRSSVGTTSSTSYMSGGTGSSSSAYRTSSYLSGSSYDSPTYSRYGVSNTLLTS